MKVKNALCAISFLFCINCTIAQQTPQFTQYNFNKYGINPGVGGINKCIDIRAGYRQQWVGFEGAPETVYLSVHKALNKTKGNNRGWHGLGVYIERDKTGFYEHKGLYPSYTYHLRLMKETIAAFGAFVGVKQQIFEGMEGGGDPAISGVQAVFVLPDITPGIWVYNPKYYTGLSVKNLFWHKMSGIGGSIGEPTSYSPHFNFIYGRRIESKKYLYMYVPSVYIKYAPFSLPSVDLNFTMYVKDQIGFGVTYRYMDAVAGLVEVKVLEYAKVSYSFDFVTSKLRNGSANTHEIGIRVSCPAVDHLPHQICPAYDY